MKTPLITLKLSKSSFLDCEIHDDDEKLPLYTVTTKGARTTATRPAFSRGEQLKLADIHWPPIVRAKREGWDGVILRFHGSWWKSAEALLEPATLLRPRRFMLPNFPHSLRWKRVGAVYHCVTRTVSGPIATLQLADGSNLPQLKVYETIQDKNGVARVPTHRGVSILLLDYLLITSLLLVTDAYDWKSLPTRKEGRSDGLKGHTPETPTSSPPVSLAQFRTLARREHTYQVPSFSRSVSDLRARRPSTSESKHPLESDLGKPIFSTVKVHTHCPSSSTPVHPSRLDVDHDSPECAPHKPWMWSHRNASSHDLFHDQSPTGTDAAHETLLRKESSSSSTCASARPWRRLPSPPTPHTSPGSSPSKPSSLSSSTSSEFGRSLPPVRSDSLLKNRGATHGRSNSTNSRRPLPPPPLPPLEGLTSTSRKTTRTNDADASDWIRILGSQPPLTPMTQTFFSPPPAYSPTDGAGGLVVLAQGS